MSKKHIVLFALFFLIPLRTVASDQSDEARIKAVVKHAFITEETAFAETVEHNGVSYGGKHPSDAFSELSEYVSNKKGYLDRLKSFLPIKENNEKAFHALIKKRKFTDFDFKDVSIDNDTAEAEVDIYTEVTTAIGATTSTEVINDEYDNVKEVRTQDYPAHDIVVNGGYKHSIKLEKNNNKWQIVWDDWGPLPGYRP